MNRKEKGHYAWDCIGELDGKRLLSVDEKMAVCRKISSSMYKPSFVVTIAVKIIPFIVWLVFLFGIKCIVEAVSVSALVYGIIIFAASTFYMIFALLFYLVKEIWVYDRWKTQEKEIMKKDVYRVPVTIGDTFRAGRKHKYCYANLRYTEEENFLDTYQITEYLYNHANEVNLYCCYYEGKPEKYGPGKYKLFFIDQEE